MKSNKACDETYIAAIERLRASFIEAHQRELPGAGTAALATSDANGNPSVRMVSIIAIDDGGPIFFTDRDSGKGRQLASNPRAGLCFFWPQLSQQAIVEGSVTVLDALVANRYWSRRPRDRQLVVWASQLDETDHDYDPLVAARKRLADQTVPCPPGWDALRVAPYRIELWKPTWRNLEPREQYTSDENGCWQLTQRVPL